MNCTQYKGAGYNLMYWYKQRPGETMKLIVITNAYGEPEFGDVDKNKFDPEKSDPKEGSLTVKDLEPDDSAIYFCSASEHSVSKTGECCTKTLLHKKIRDSISQQVAVWYNQYTVLYNRTVCTGVSRTDKDYSQVEFKLVYRQLIVEFDLSL